MTKLTRRTGSGLLALGSGAAVAAPCQNPPAATAFLKKASKSASAAAPASACTDRNDSFTAASMLSNGIAAAELPPSAFAASISTSPGSRVSHRGSTAGWPTVRIPKPTPGSGTSSTHRSSVVWLGKIKSAITDDSSRKDAKLAMNGTLLSAFSKRGAFRKREYGVCVQHQEGLDLAARHGAHQRVNVGFGLRAPRSGPGG